MYPPSVRRGPGAGAGWWETTGTGNPQSGEGKVDESLPIVAVISTLVSTVVVAFHIGV